MPKARTRNFEGDDGLKNYLSEMLDGASAVASDATDRAASATKVVTLVTCRSLSLSNTRAVTWCSRRSRKVVRE